MDLSILEEALFDELVKISRATGPGSRGGKVVGYRKGGDPIYASEKNRDKDMVPMKKPPVVARAVGGAMGAGMVAAQVPFIRRVAKGRTTLYHGTNLDAATSIMSSKKGIDPSFAGVGTRAGAADYARSVSEGLGANLPPSLKKGMQDVLDDVGIPKPKKKAMINRYLMAESFNRMLEGSKVPLTHDQLIRTTERFHELMDGGMKSGAAADKVYGEITDDLVKAKKMTTDQVAKVRASLGSELSRHGQRAYMGYSPTDVMEYATGKSEGQKATEKLLSQDMSAKGQVKRNLKMMGETMTAGLPTTVKDTLERVKFKPNSVEVMTADQAQKELARLKGSGQKLKAVFGASVSVKNLGYLEDFPVARQLLNLNPGIKHSLKDMGFETYEAGRDISFPHEIPRKNIRSVDLIDDAGKVRRIMISDSTEAAKAGILRRARKLALPAAIAALGGYSIYRAFKPKKRMVHKSHPMADLPEKEKKSGVASDVGHIAKYVVPAAAVTGALGYGGHRVMEKVIPKRYPETAAEQIAEAPRQAGRMLGGGAIGMGAGAGIGAGIGALRPGPLRHLSRRQAAAIGAAAGGTAGAMFSPLGAAGREQAMVPEADPHFAPLPGKVQDWIREHPGVGSAKNVAIGTALPLGAALTLRKYYPATFARGVKHVKGLADL